MTMPKSVAIGRNPGTYDDGDRRAAFGEVLNGGFKHIRLIAALAASSYQLATLKAVGLPDHVRCGVIHRCNVPAGGATGEFTCDAPGTTPLTTHVAPAPNGDIVFLGTDAPTDANVYASLIPVDTVELTLDSTSSSVFDLPATARTNDGTLVTLATRGVLFLMECSVLAGTTLGKKIILVPGAAPATTKANLNVAGTQVLLNVATDAATKIRVKLAIGRENV